MIFKRSSLRYAHITGHTSVAYTEGGEFILTCGSDGDLRIWSCVDDDDPTSTCLGEYVKCIAHSGEKLFVSSDRNTLQRYTFPDMNRDGVLLRFTAPVTCIRVVDTFVAAGSEDTVIKVLRDGQTESQLEGHTGPVLGLDVSSKNNVLASVAGDGCLKIWSLETGTEIKCIPGLACINSFDSAVQYGSPRFEPQHQRSLAYANGQELVVLNSNSWGVQCVLTDECTSGIYTCCQFSHDGQYLAAGTNLGEISIFDFVRRVAVKCELPSSESQSITCLAWHPLHNEELAYCDSSGQLGSFFCPSGDSDMVATIGLVEDDTVDFGDIRFNEVNDGVRASVKMSIPLDEDADNENCVSIEQLKQKIIPPTTRGDRHHSDDDGDDDVGSRDSATGPTTMGSGGIKLFKRQAAFQPGATPVHLANRYLAWNKVGIVTLHADSADGAIDVEFHDVSVHHSMHIPNYAGHTMAALSVGVLALASVNSTKLVCVALAASGNKEWSVCMPDCECIEAVAATATLVGVATSAQQLRLFTTLGTQREVISLPGPVVAMAGHNECILVCYHSAPCSEAQQHISALFLHTYGLALRSQQLSIALPVGRQLTWLGFSDCGSPAFSDNIGLLQLYSRRSGCWHPVCDMLKHSHSVSNNYFVVAVSEKDRVVQAVLCRGAAYPVTNPRPLVQELAMQVPLCDIETEKSQLEDVLLRAYMLEPQPSDDKTIKEFAIKLFALACHSEQEARAKELIETIACPELLSLAVKYATKVGRIHLSDRLCELHSTLQDRTEAYEELNSSSINNYSSPFALTSKLAPKKIEFTGSTKRAQALKRFAATTTASSSKTPVSHHCMEEAAPTASTSSNSQLNTFSKDDRDDNFEDDMDGLSSNGKEKCKYTQESGCSNAERMPLNALNPFASSKRKLSDVDFLNSGSALANKFKMPKK